ncbi:MAG: ABC transporter ATP-binding protein [Myxococcota bacterium]
MAAASALISYHNVWKAFGEQPIYRGFNLSVHRGETLCIIGPSGFGKTVALKMLIGLIRPDEGEVVFDGTHITSLSSDTQLLPIRRRIAMVFQAAALFDSISVFENIAYPLREQFDLTEEEIRARVMEKLAWVDLPDAAHKMPSQLSGGMKKRIGLARAIVTQPEVILYDEPTAGLDPVGTRRITDLIITLHQRLDCTGIVVTHDMPMVARIAHRIALMGDHKVRAVGTFDELLAHPDADVRDFLTANETPCRDAMNRVSTDKEGMTTHAT